MRLHTQIKASSIPSFKPVNSKLLQRTCACGGTAGLDGECTECRHKSLAGQMPSIIQTKLRMSSPSDKYEQEADRVADSVLRIPEPSIQRQIPSAEEGQSEMIQIKPKAYPISPLILREIDSEEEEDEEFIQTKPHSEQEPSVIQRQVDSDEKKEDEEEEAVQAKQASSQSSKATSKSAAHIQSLRDGGQPLSESTRVFFESCFGHDFSRVRVHTDAEAINSAKSVNALAYTVGEDIAFNQGQYAPDSTAGKRLLAHELTHVVQQTGIRRSGVQRFSAKGQNHKQISHARNHDQSQVDVRASSDSAPKAAALGAVAFTVRNKVFVPPGLQSPHTLIGRKVLAHEIIHAHQWQNGQNNLAPVWSREQLESEAHHLSHDVVQRRSIKVQGVYRGSEALLHPIFISTHGKRGYLNLARQFYIRWGFGTPVSVSSIEEMLAHLAGGSGNLGKVTLVSHAVPQNINISFLRGMLGFTLENQWEVDTPEEVAGLAMHVTDESFLATIHQELRGDRETRREMDLLQSGGWLSEPIIKQYLWWLVDAWFIRNQRIRGRSRRRRRRQQKRLDQIAAEASARAKTFQEITEAVLAFTAGLPSSQRAFSFRVFESHFTRVMTGSRPGRIGLSRTRRFIRSRSNIAVERVFQDVVSGGADFFENLEAVRERLSLDSHIEVQGCRVGRQRSYLQAMSRFFNGALVSAPDIFQIFGHVGYKPINRENDAAFRRLWRRRAIRRAFQHWFPIITGEAVPARPTWRDLAGFMRAGHPLIVGRHLYATRTMSEDAFVEFLRRQGHRLREDDEISQTFLQGRSLKGAIRFAIIDWLQERRSGRGAVIFRPDPEYDNHIIKERSTP